MMMIARDAIRPSGQPSRARVVGDALLLRWRIILTRVLEGALRAGSSIPGRFAHVAGTARAFVRGGGFSDVRHPAMRWYGALAVCAGWAVGVLIASPGVPRMLAAFAGGMSLVWAIVRAVAVRFAAPDLVAENPAALRGALGVGLLVYAFAVTPEARLAAWVASAGLTGWLATREGLPQRRVWQVVAVAWGCQAVVVLGEWLARNAFVAILASRG